MKSGIETLGRPAYREPTSGNAKLEQKARDGSALKKMLLRSLQDSGSDNSNASFGATGNNWTKQNYADQSRTNQNYSAQNKNYYGESTSNNQNWPETSGFDQINSSRVINWYIENRPEGKQTIIVL